MSELAEISLDRGPAPAARLSLGARLAAARTERGIELPDVAARTRIPARMLAAIEGDRYEELPNITFAIGFVKSFAREVSLDPTEAAAQFRAENTRVPIAPPATPMVPLESNRVPSRRLAVGTLALVIAGAVLGAIGYAAGLFDPEPVAEPVIAAAPVAPPAAAPMAPPAYAPPVGAPLDGAVATVTAPPGPVTLTATEDVWLQVRDRATGARAMSGILVAGQSYAVPQGDMLLWTGKAGAITVSVAGRALPPLGGPVETVRDISLSPEALISRAASAGPAAGGEAAMPAPGR